MEPGEIWAYRKTGKHPLEPVRFLKHRRGTGRKYEYSLVRFEDPDAKGLEEWVPDGRLKCQWADAEAFSARERRWAAVKSASIVSDDIDWAVGVTLDSLTPMGMIDGCGGRTGISPYKIGDVSALSRLCGIPEDDLTSPPTAFKEGERFIVPFETAARVARTLAAQHPEVVLRAVEREERDFEERQYEWRQHGSPPRGRKFEAWDEALRRSFQMRRDWVGKHHDVLWREVLIARIEVQRMRELVESAANMLQANGHMASAARLRRSLNPNAKPE